MLVVEMMNNWVDRRTMDFEIDDNYFNSFKSDFTILDEIERTFDEESQCFSCEELQEIYGDLLNKVLTLRKLLVDEVGYNMLWPKFEYYLDY
jgi:ClpP class serine protease